MVDKGEREHWIKGVGVLGTRQVRTPRVAWLGGGEHRDSPNSSHFYLFSSV